MFYIKYNIFFTFTTFVPKSEILVVILRHNSYFLATYGGVCDYTSP